MLEKLKKILTEYQEIENRLADPNVISDQKLLRELSKKYSELSEIATCAKKIELAEKNLNDTEELLKNEKDPEIYLMAEEEKKRTEEEIFVLAENAQKLLIPKDPNDDRNVIMEIRAGTGGEEAALFAGELARMYLRFAEQKNFATEIINQSEAESGGMKEIFFQVIGKGAYGILKFESGVHRVQRIPETESKGRIHTSAATVAVLPEMDETAEIELRSEDLDIMVCRASGAGGQHVNKTDSAVRIVHKPTGIAVECQESRSQQKNRTQAMSVLRSKIYMMEKEKKDKELGEARLSQIGTGDRSEKIRTYNFPQDRITDHRIKISWSNLPGIMEGNLDNITKCLQEADLAQKMK